ncbi:MAG TPA: alpha/beta fold hydrolase [Thermomicrobiales bacterium]|nr:alpha/beta fold hydrolase [Thermomicrobiales bacterium]
MIELAPAWDGYYDPDERQDIQLAINVNTVTVDGNDLRVRVYEQHGDAPTVLVAHGLLGYGLVFARFHLPFWRRGWRVVQFDLPGCGESGGPRGAATVQDIMAAWLGIVAWAARTYGAPVFAMGNAEDGVVSYYALANHPSVGALSVHTLFEYGDPADPGWVQPPWAVRVVRVALGLLARNRPRTTLPGSWTIPFKHVFAGPDDADYRRRLKADPLALQRGGAPLGYSLVKRFSPPVKFEDCATPVQVIISTRSRLWRADAIRRSAERLGGPREIVEIDEPHWEMSREFHDMYSEHVMRWFDQVRDA